MAGPLTDVHSSLALDAASKIIDTAIALRRKESLLPMVVAVLDAGGNLVAFKREDGSGVLRYDIAFGKARAALGMGMSTRLIRDRLGKQLPQRSTCCAGRGDVLAEGKAVAGNAFARQHADDEDFPAVRKAYGCRMRMSGQERCGHARNYGVPAHAVEHCQPA